MSKLELPDHLRGEIRYRRERDLALFLATVVAALAVVVVLLSDVVWWGADPPRCEDDAGELTRKCRTWQEEVLLMNATAPDAGRWEHR